MPSDDYAFAGSGALKLKGAKVKKHKKKKDKSDLETALSTGQSSGARERKADPTSAEEEDEAAIARRKEKRTEDPDNGKNKAAEEDEEDETPRHKTEAERRFEEARRKKLLQLSESAGSRPELFKTHKERVEELNTYLSKLSEHHDMPKIGPG